MTPEGSDGEKFEVSAVVRAVLEETRHSVTLHPAVKKSSLTYIMGFAMGEDAEEVKASMPTEPAEWMETFSEAWQAVGEKLMPAFVSSRCGQWCGAEVKPETPPTTASPIKKMAWSSGGAMAMAPSAASGDEVLAEKASGAARRRR